MSNTDEGVTRSQWDGREPADLDGVIFHLSSPAGEMASVTFEVVGPTAFTPSPGEEVALTLRVIAVQREERLAKGAPRGAEGGKR